MADVLWLACHSVAPIDRVRFDQWATAVETAIAELVGPATGMVRETRVETHLALVAWSDPSAAPAAWTQLESTARGLAITDGIPIGHDTLGVPPAPIAISDALHRDPDAVGRMQSPFASVALLDGSLRLVIDALGFAKVYQARAAGLTVWASRPTLAALATFGSADASLEGWTTALSHDRFYGETSAVTAVTVEPPSTRILATGTPDAPTVTVGDIVGPLFDHHLDPDALPERIETALAAFHRSLAGLGGTGVRVALSGGRDSRVLAATAHRSGTLGELFTSTPPRLDLEIAQTLTERLTPPVPWTVMDRGASTQALHDEAMASGRRPADLWDRLAAYQAHADGEGDLSPAQAMRTGSNAIDLSLWGLGGEFARAFFYAAADLAAPEDRVRAFWAAIERGPSFVHPSARSAVLAPRATALQAWLDERSIVGLSQLDYFYVFERMRRQKGRVGTTAGIRPYFRTDYARAALGQTPDERVATDYYEVIVRRALPAWAGVPYSHQRKSERPDDATMNPQAVVFWDAPYTEPLGRLVSEALSEQQLVLPAVAARLLQRPAPGADPVRAMRLFDRLLNYATYLTYLDTTNRRFRDAGGRALIDPTGEIPRLVVDLSPPKPVRTARSLLRLPRRIGRRIRTTLRGRGAD